MALGKHLDGRLTAELPKTRPKTLWRNPDFLKFWSGETLSLFGTQITNLALPMTAVLVFKASAQQVGVLRFLQLVPYLFLALLFGVWVDRGRRKPIMMVANAARLVLIGLVPLLWHYHHLSMAGLLAIACLVGVFSVLFDVSWMSFVPSLVKEPEQYVDANQKLGVTQSTSDVAGPGVAGVVIGWIGPATAMLLDAVSYLASLLSLLWIRTPEPAPPSVARRSVGRELREGARWVFGDQYLRQLAVFAPFTNGSLNCVSTLFLVYAVRDKGLSAAAVGSILSVASVGALAGVLVSKTLMRRSRIGLVYGLALSGIYAGPLLLLPAMGPRPLVIGMFMLSFLASSFGGGLSNVIQLSIRQIRTPQALMGRMSAAFRTLLFGGGALGGLLGGVVGEAMGLRAGLTLVAVLSAAMLVPIALSRVVRLREMPPPAEEPVAAV